MSSKEILLDILVSKLKHSLKQIAPSIGISNEF